jgi:hypothetical protein
MEQKNFVKQMVDFNRMAFDNMYNTAVVVQDQTERFGGMLLDSAPFGGDQAKQMYRDSTELYRKGRDNFKKMMDEGFNMMEGIMSQPFEQRKS